MKQLSFLFFLFSATLLISCSQPDPIPRPTGYPRIDLPEHGYQKFDNEICPFSFEYPQIGEIERTKSDSCWADFYFPDFNCRWHITYRQVPGSGKSRSDHYEEYRKLVFKHIQKASQIQETPVQNENGFGTLFELYGTVGVPAQLIYGDSSNLIMVSFYFDTAVRNDSLSPVIDFMKEDLRHLAKSVNWEN